MKTLYIIVDANYGDQGVDPICCSFSYELLEKELERLREIFSKKYSFGDEYSIQEIDFIE